MRFAVLFVVIFTILQVSAQLKVKQKVDPSYPLLPWQARLQGDVTVKVELGADGNVMSAVASGGSPLLQRAAEENARLWIFSDVTRNEQTLTITYAYRILEPTNDKQWGTRLPVKFDLPNRVEISVYRLRINV